MANLADLLVAPSATLGDIAELLGSMSPLARRDALAHTNRAQQRALYQKAASGDDVTLEDFVPTSLGARVEVKHHGRNTLPLPGAFRTFQKVFCRPESDDTRLFGFNEGASRPLIGPGYYVAVSTSGNTEWQSRGSLVVDYFQVPDSAVVEGWPKVVPNSKGLQMFVYQGTRDFMRKVCDGVTIGAAYKGEKALDHYFTLVRDR
jgi:hypothetical protein